MYKIVLLRHGESTWNKKGLFTGWTDVGLTKKGEREAVWAGQELRRRGYVFDLAYTSYLRRAARTLALTLRALKLTKIPIRTTWLINERYYGDLQSLSHVAMAKKFGLEQVFLWRRSYSIRPPKISAANPYNQKDDPKYKGVKVPTQESLKDVVARVIPFWRQEIGPEIKAGRKIIITASGNSLRAIIKYLDKMSAKDITQLNIPFAIPLVYELNDKLRPIRHYYLADKKKLAREIERVKRMTIIKL